MCESLLFYLSTSLLFFSSIVPDTVMYKSAARLSNFRCKGKKGSTSPRTIHPTSLSSTRKKTPNGGKYLVLRPTTRDHACASRRRSHARSCTSTTFAPRYRTPRRIRIRSFTLPLVNQPSHALIRFLRCRRLHFIARRRGNR